MPRRIGGHAVAQVLAHQGVNHVFCVPGESFLSVLDGLYDTDIQVVATRHESGAAFMAEAYAKATGEVGVCMATRGVGAANLAIGLHTARQDSTPVVALLGQVERPYQGREAFQEVDLAAWLAHICKWTVEVRDPDRIPELIERAFYLARSGRPGPVAVVLPHDVLDAPCAADPAPRPIPVAAPAPDPGAVSLTWHALRRTRRGVVLAGGGVLRAGATPQLVQLAERLQLPVVTAFRRYDAFPNSHPSYAGWLGFGPAPSVLQAFREAQVVLAIGTRLSQVTTQDYTLPIQPQRLIHVDVDPSVFAAAIPPAHPVISDARRFLSELIAFDEAAADPGRGIVADEADAQELASLAEARAAWVRELHAAYLRFSTPQPAPGSPDGPVDLDAFMVHFNEVFPPSTVITSDAGNFFGWLARYRRFEHPVTYIGPTSGAMGYGLPAAIGVKAAYPDQLVVSFSGDGGFMMTMAELETAVRCKLPVLAIVINNNLYGTIRAHQERQFPGRVIATDLGNPDFADFARTFGAIGLRITRNADIRAALEEARDAVQSGRAPVVIEVLADPSVLTVGQRHG
jgi:acetolactate synthase-1/2/3 large subunit